jgi:hypothetical protein
MSMVHVGISSSANEIRVLALSRPNEPILKARLSPTPSHPRAMATLLEALALWEGHRVHAALCAGSKAGLSDLGPYRSSELRDGPLYAVEWVPACRPVRRRRQLGGLGDFGDLRQLVLEEAWS